MHSAQRVAQIFISAKKVDCTSFQQLHHDYVTAAHDFFPFTLSIPPWFNLVLSFIGWEFYNFDPECHIQIKTDASGYSIGGVLSQLAPETSPDGVVTKTDLGQWHPVTFFSRKIISAETRYKTYNGELPAIIEVFKTWRHYLEGYKHEVLVLTDHNNLRHFIDTKILSSKQVS